MKPNQVLAQQIEMVDGYIATQWPVASSQAQNVSLAKSDISQILIGGCGDSHHAALGLELAFGEYTGCWVTAMDSMRLARYAPSLSGRNPESSLVIGISNSGEVARTIEALEIWSDAGARTLAFTSNAESTLARIADQSLVLPPPNIQHGPGLLSYIGSLLLGFATLVHSILDVSQHRISDLIDQTPELLREWLPNEVDRSEQFAGTVSEGIAVFLGSGAAKGSARFGAAKVIEAVGERSWAQDVEEWAHLEYFCEPAAMPTILLSAQGRSSSRELEVIEAMNVLGRKVLLSNWMGGKGWSSLEREALSPLALWAAPCAYASRRAEIHSAKPFRDFGGGRDRQEGGGASRIRSSKRVGLEDLERLF